mgnify:CR=1 FL=1
MSIQYIGLSEINGPLVALDHVKGVGYDEIANIRLSDGTERVGRIVEISGEKAILQVFGGTKGLSLTLQANQWSLLCLRKCWAEYSAVRENLLTDWEIFIQKSLLI